jgi:DNA polymerase-3 subunit epsilon
MNRQIILDTETTGLDPKSGHRVIEIGCVEIVNRRFTGEEFHVYLNPDRDSDEGALRVHGLTTEFLRDKPHFLEVHEDFVAFIKDSELLIHNAEFDVGFLNNEIRLLAKKNPPIASIVKKITDTLQIAREKHPGQRNSLDALVGRYDVGGYDRELHGALLDSKILGDVYLAMTGGQSALDFESDTIKDAEEIEDSKKDLLQNSSRPLVIDLTTEEKEANKVYLKKMEDETGVKPRWLSTTNGE